MGVESSDDPVIESGQYRQVLGHFPTGVTAVTANGAERPVGVAIGSFVSISLDPPLVGFFLDTDSGSWPAIEASGHFCVNVLGSDQQELCGVMASTSEDKFTGVETTAAPRSGAPILPGAQAVIDCRIEQVVPTGDHNLIIGRVLSLSASEDVGAGPMVFYKGQYGSFGA